MYKKRNLTEMARDSSLLFPKADISAQKSRPKTLMGPPPPVKNTRPLQDSARQNANLYRPFRTVTPAPDSGRKDANTESKLKGVSLASILKRSRNFDSANESGRESGREGTHSARKESERKGGEFVPRYKRRKVHIANPLYEEYKDCIEASRETLESQGRTALNEAFEDLTTYVKELALEKEGQVATTRTQLASVLAPSNNFKNAAGETVDVIAKIEGFKKLLEEEEKVQKDKWEEWERLQEEVATLGFQVLGDVAADDVPEELFYSAQREEGGYKTDSEKWMKELEEELKGPMEEIRSAGEEALKKMAAAEKECEDKFRQQKAKIVAAITMDDD